MAPNPRFRTFSALLLTGLVFLAIIPPTVAATRTAKGLQAGASSPSPSIHRTFWLRGNAALNWNRTNPGPFLPVVSSDTVTILLISDDALTHSWFLDLNNNNIVDTNEVSSPFFSSTTTFMNFTFIPVIGTNVPSGGNFTYRCAVHPLSMFGTFRVMPEQISNSVSSTSSLDASKVTVTGSLTIDTRTLTVSGSLMVTAVDSTGATTFTKTYLIPNLQMRSVPGSSSFVLRFLVNVAVLPYAQSVDLTVGLSGLTMSSTTILTRQLDINANGLVDIVDVSAAALAFGSSIGSPKYNPTVDFDASGSINIIDISIIAVYFGATDLR